MSSGSESKARRPGAAASLDVLIVSLGATGGLRAVDDELLSSLHRAGASAAIVRPEPPAPVRTLMLTDLRWARAARRAAMAELACTPARALIYSTTTAALLWPRPGAIRFDAPAAANRPGRHGLWQRPLERRRLREAPLLLAQSEGALLEVTAAVRAARPSGSALVLPVPVEPSEPHPSRTAGQPRESQRLTDACEPSESRISDASCKSSGSHAVRDIAAITYAANPAKKGLDIVLDAWRGARRPGEELLVAGVDERELRSLGYQLPAAGVRVVGMLAHEDYRALLRCARTYVCAARREDYGIAQLEALADGCMLVTTPSPGPYVALPIARQLDERLVGDDLGGAIRTALDDPSPSYAEGALSVLAPFRRDAVDRQVAEQLLPLLLA
ncbi:MAG TPA: glycosyltransferase [Solirubrobacteraceae bacterium]|nr:glycosyltransferase [Solirubrobacteraceae bacterium]